MISRLLSRFRKPMPLTPAEASEKATALARDAFGDDRLSGFVLGIFHPPGSDEADAVMALRGAFASDFYVLLKAMLATDKREAALAAILKALRDTRSVEMEDDCPCPTCSTRRETNPQEVTRH